MKGKIDVKVWEKNWLTYSNCGRYGKIDSTVFPIWHYFSTLLNADRFEVWIRERGMLGEIYMTFELLSVGIRNTLLQSKLSNNNTNYDDLMIIFL